MHGQKNIKKLEDKVLGVLTIVRKEDGNDVRAGTGKVLTHALFCTYSVKGV